ncbi:MAG TPA: VapC toxin family PIN domain ribonuclease [Allosphingosinicella sp.]
MILADTTIWVDHLACVDVDLARLLNLGDVLGHPFVTAEIALGSLANRDATVALLDSLPQAQSASQPELMQLISSEHLGGVGIGFVDAHLLAACRLAGSALWTRDKRLRAQAQRLGLAWSPG